MGKDKLRKFKENEGFTCLVQPSTNEVLGRDHALKGNWNRDFFGNDRPIIVELGCGKGEYTIDLALRNPDFNYIGVDIKGARLWKGAKFAHENALPNVAFLRTRIEFIESLFAPGEISEIWITFADPQIGREKKRLTSPLFLSRYRNFLRPGGILHLKTDSRYLFEYSKAIAEQNELKILAWSTDIYGGSSVGSDAGSDAGSDVGAGLAARAGVAGGAGAVGSGSAGAVGSGGAGAREGAAGASAAAGLAQSSGSREALYASELGSICGRDAIDALFAVQTFYEKQYLAQGLPITYLAFTIDHDGPYLSPDWDPDLWPR